MSASKPNNVHTRIAIEAENAELRAALQEWLNVVQSPSYVYGARQLGKTEHRRLVEQARALLAKAEKGMP